MAPAPASISKTLVVKIRRGGTVFIPTVPLKWVPTVPPSSSFSTAASVISSLPESQENERGSGWSRLLLFVPGAISFGLGTWQIFRRQDKIKMLEYRQNKLGMEPLNWNDITTSSKSMEPLEFRRVVLKGVFDEDKPIYVGPRSRSISGVTENGYYLITSLKPILDNPESVQIPVLVNRGWVPRTWRDKSLEVSKYDVKPVTKEPISTQESTASSWWRFWSKKPDILEVPEVTPVEVVGVVRGSEKPSIFVPANDPSSNQWFYVDVAAIARACGLPEDTVYLEDINDKHNPSNRYPVPKDVNTLIHSSVMPQDHLNYTLTWYSLSAALTFMAFQRLKPKKSRR